MSRQAPEASSPITPAPRVRPRDAATLIVIDNSPQEPRLLMGRRRPDQVFLPDTFVFPGGRVENIDRSLARHVRLPISESACVQLAMHGKPTDTRAAALALAAIRETFEETGLLIGEPARPEHPVSPKGWETFLGTGFWPSLDNLTYFARAITPPARPRRYDTRFFVVDATKVAHRSDGTDGELLDIDWFTISAAKRLKLPSITRHIIEDIAAFVELPHDDRRTLSVPFYAYRRGAFHRTLMHRS